ncbi:MAG TPA: hypothetical protein VHX62_09605 [Solirubrobacteraceae bacterium]|jgi:hypothetical protein|nr:hypothetical protein [Solirubrobacteraceae bacterium]
MGRGTSSFTPAGRDAGLRRLRAFNRLLVAVAVAATALLTDVVAQAFPGHKRVVATPPSIVRAAAPRASARTARRRTVDRRHAGDDRLRRPAQAPTSAATRHTHAAAPQATAPQATTRPATAAPAPQPAAPAPVVSGGS